MQGRGDMDVLHRLGGKMVVVGPDRALWPRRAAAPAHLSSPVGAAFSWRPTHHGGHPESAPGMVAAGFSFAGGDLPEVVISSFAGGDRPASWLFWRISRFVS